MSERSHEKLSLLGGNSAEAFPADVAWLERLAYRFYRQTTKVRVVYRA